MVITKYRSQFLDLRRNIKVEVEFTTDQGIHRARKLAWDRLAEKLERTIPGTGSQADPEFYSELFTVEQIDPMAETGESPSTYPSIPFYVTSTITKQLSFEAAHRLGSWTWSKCHRLHGHSYKLKVTVAGPLDQHGAVMDFEQLSRLMKEQVFEVLDHQNINEVLHIENATAELIAIWIWNALEPSINNNSVGRVLYLVQLYETENSWVSYFGGSVRIEQ